MDTLNTAPNGTADEINLDLTGLLGSDQVFAAEGDPLLQAELIDANCNKIGVEGGCCLSA